MNYITVKLTEDQHATLLEYASDIATGWYADTERFPDNQEYKNLYGWWKRLETRLAKAKTV